MSPGSPQGSVRLYVIVESFFPEHRSLEGVGALHRQERRVGMSSRLRQGSCFRKTGVLVGGGRLHCDLDPLTVGGTAGVTEGRGDVVPEGGGGPGPSPVDVP